MSALTRYAYLDCRVSIHAEGLLDPRRMDLFYTQPLEQAGDLLQQARLADLAAEPPADAGALEQSLISSHLAETVTLIRPLRGPARALLLYWMRRYELINLKRIIRRHLTVHADRGQRGDLLDLGDAAQLPLQELVQSEDIAELLRRLDSTVYAGMARRARRVYEEQHSLFDLEAALDQEYHAGLAEHVQKLPAGDQITLQPLIGTLIDENNLVWLLRYRFNFGLSPPHAYMLLAPPGRHLDRNKLLGLVQLDSFADVIAGLPAALQKLLGEARSILEVAKTLDLHLQRAARRVLRHTVFNLARALAFLILRERQLLKIHVALKGKLLRLDEGLIRAAATLPEALLETSGPRPE